MSVVMISFWRNDADRHIQNRMEHLFEKKGVDRWIWGFGDCSDNTSEILSEFAQNKPISVVDCTTGIVGEDLGTRRKRIAATNTKSYAHINDVDTYVCVHESDLQSSPKVIELLWTNRVNTAVAGWPMLGNWFYDTYGYRGLDGTPLIAHYPYHADWQPATRFPVSSFGSVWLAPAHMMRNYTMPDDCCVGLCQQWIRQGYQLLVDPTVRIVQPYELWSAQ